jgi:probable lipoprotein NlpC
VHRTALAIASAAALAAACAGVPAAPRDDRLPERLAERAASLAGHAGRFEVDGRAFPADCSGFVEAVYEAEGVPLRALMTRAAPDARSAVAAAYLAAERFGRTFGAGVRPLPGDLVFFHHTYDRDRNGRLDEHLSHVGIVEAVSGDTVAFLHRGAAGVVRALMTLPRRDEARAGDGRPLNSPLRRKRAEFEGAPLLAGQLFAAYGRFDAGRVASERAR